MNTSPPGGDTRLGYVSLSLDDITSPASGLAAATRRRGHPDHLNFQAPATSGGGSDHWPRGLPVPQQPATRKFRT